MGSVATPRILLCAGEPAAVVDLRALLEEAGLASDWHPLHEAGPDNAPAYSLAILDGSRRHDALRYCRGLRSRMGDGFMPMLFVTAEHAPEARLAALENGADACLLRPFTPGELLAQVQALLRIKEMHDRLTEKTTELHRANKRLRLAYEQIDQELELARLVQQSFLPAALPEVPWARFAVHYRPCGRVGGDFYDAFRLDEHHVAFYVADAMGHGVPASLLTIYLKQGVRAKEVFGRQYRLVPPGEVLQRLNRDLIDQGTSESRFITMIYGLLDGRDGTVHFARAGHPHPLHVPAEGEPHFWQVDGSLLGVFDTEFPVQMRSLRPGDKLLFYTDGTDGAAVEGLPAGEGLRACAARHRALPVERFVERLSAELLRQPNPPDDLTLLALEMKAAPGPFLGLGD